MSETTNTFVANAASKAGVLPLGGTTLIGTITSPSGPKALLRNIDGQITTAAVGDMTPAGQIIAIADSEVVLQSTSGQTRLGIPAG